MKHCAASVCHMLVLKHRCGNVKSHYSKKKALIGSYTIQLLVLFVYHLYGLNLTINYSYQYATVGFWLHPSYTEFASLILKLSVYINDLWLRALNGLASSNVFEPLFSLLGHTDPLTRWFWLFVVQLKAKGKLWPCWCCPRCVESFTPAQKLLPSTGLWKSWLKLYFVFGCEFISPRFAKKVVHALKKCLNAFVVFWFSDIPQNVLFYPLRASVFLCRMFGLKACHELKSWEAIVSPLHRDPKRI